MLEALLMFIIWLIVIVAVAMLVLWAVRQFMPEVYPPARLVVGAIALIMILILLVRVVERVGSPF